MTLIPHRTVASQIAAQLSTEIENGIWRDWLPTERTLWQKMQASRNTVRGAINHLKAEGLIASEKPVGNRILAGSRRPRKKGRPKSVGIIIPAAINARASGGGALVGAICSAAIVLTVRSVSPLNVYAYAPIGLTSCFVFGWIGSRILPAQARDLAGLTFKTLKRQSCNSSQEFPSPCW